MSSNKAASRVVDACDHLSTLTCFNTVNPLKPSCFPCFAFGRLTLPDTFLLAMSQPDRISAPHLSLAGSRHGNNSHRPRPLLCPAHQIRPAANGDPFLCCIQKSVSQLSCARPLELRRIKTCMHSLTHLKSYPASLLLGTKHNTEGIRTVSPFEHTPIHFTLWSCCYLSTYSIP